jgi:DNA-binding LacI/PurR family transcriptional regulator
VCSSDLEDLALCVFDDLGYYAYFNPSITAISFDEHQLAERSVQFLNDRISRSYTGAARTERIPCQLHVRESSAGRIAT